MADTKREIEFDGKKFMEHVRGETRDPSLREIAMKVGVSASTLSRIDNGAIPDLNIFMAICAACEMNPGDYFKWVTWKRVDE